MLKKDGFDIRLIPIPNEISAGCGLSLKIKVEQYKKIVDILKNGDICDYKCFEIIKNGFNKKIKEI